ncbi:tol-pal system protein YbgF [Zoogloea sp. LCSB751]|uniref:tol-pal system protein YbgF n=1 Tax=Zoogloea sp. LCSB751 TaxID=1965277 RepID=UPI0009A4D793|nr:tol-pal system protein YbgF [Zoogloea sp. LCSB751]
MVRRLLPLLLAGLFSAHAHAGLFDDEEARARITKMRDELTARINKLEDASNRAQLDFANQIEQLKAEIARLRGENEVLTNDLANANKRQKDFYVDLDNRLRKLESTPAAGEAPQQAQPQQPTAAVDPAAETRDYEAALNLLRGGKYKDAAAGFNAFIKNYPNSAFQPNAHFWAASAQYQAKDNAGAAEHYAKVANQWPDDTRAPDALLGLANALQGLNDAKGATKSLERLIAKYPNSSAAQIARQRLKK